MADLFVIPDRMIADLFECTGAPTHGLNENVSALMLGNVLGLIDAEPARVVTDASGHVVSINPAFSRLCGFCFDEIRGRKPGSLLQGPATTLESIEVLREGIRNLKPCEVEMLNYHKDKTPYHVHIRLEPLVDAEGAHTGFVATETKLS